MAEKAEKAQKAQPSSAPLRDCSKGRFIPVADVIQEFGGVQPVVAAHQSGELWSCGRRHVEDESAEPLAPIDQRAWEECFFDESKLELFGNEYWGAQPMHQVRYFNIQVEEKGFKKLRRRLKSPKKLGAPSHHAKRWFMKELDRVMDEGGPRFGSPPKLANYLIRRYKETQTKPDDPETPTYRTVVRWLDERQSEWKFLIEES